MSTPDATETAEVVPLHLLTDLARLGQRMRKAQLAYFAARKEQPHVNHSPLFREARAAEARFDAAAADALARERRPLPGMEGGDAAGG